MPKDIVIVGAGGHGREVAMLIEEINASILSWNILGFVDDCHDSLDAECLGYPVIGAIEDYFLSHKEVSAVIAVGDSRTRLLLWNRIRGGTVSFPSLIHPGVRVHSSNMIGEGVILCRGACITVNVSLGGHVHINTNSTVAHESKLDDFATLSPGVNISGNVSLGRGAFLGTGAQVAPSVEVGEGAMVGAGATVIKNLTSNVVAVGSPAKAIKELTKI